MPTTTAPAIPALLDAPTEDRLAVAIGAIARQAPDQVAIVSQAGSNARRSIDYPTIAQAITRL